MGIISFHSLEDRLVKHELKGSPLLRVLTKKPIQPASEEVATNPVLALLSSDWQND